MTKRDVAILACRILGLWILSSTLLAFIGSWYLIVVEITYRGGPGTTVPVFAGMASAFLASIAIAALLWFGAGWFARRMVGDDDGPAFPTQLDRTSVLAISLTVVGVVLLFLGFIEFVGWTVDMIYSNVLIHRTGRDSILFIGPRASSELAGAIVQMGLGLWLSIGSRGVVKLIRRLRAPVTRLRRAGWGRKAGVHDRG